MDARLRDTVLLVEDNEDDILLLKRAFRKAGLASSLSVVKDGEEAIKYLAGMDPYAERARYPVPFMMLLDLRLPRVSGFEVLSWIRNQPAFHNLTVVVLTVSDTIQDMNRAYFIGANSYLVKPGNFDGLVAQVQQIRECHWPSVRDPPRSQPVRATHHSA